VWLFEIGRTLGQIVTSGSEDDPSGGLLLRAATMIGAGEGSVRVANADGSTRSGSADVLVMAAGLEGGFHGGGASMHGGGIFVGTGVKYSRYLGAGTAVDTISPYVSLTIEGGIVLRILGEGLRGLSFARACR
jgi:hypothetical protein